MILCDHCDRVVPRDELCVDEHRDLHQKCLEMRRASKTIIAFAKWYDANGKLGVSAPDAIRECFGEWLARQNISVEITQTDPPPPLTFPTRPQE